MAALLNEDQDTFDKYGHEKTLSSTLVSPIGKNTNSRWYCNDLEKKDKIVDDSNVSTILSSPVAKIKSVINNNDDHVKVANALCRRVMKRLIDISSPASESKKFVLQLDRE